MRQEAFICCIFSDVVCLLHEDGVGEHCLPSIYRQTQTLLKLIPNTGSVPTLNIRHRKTNGKIRTQVSMQFAGPVKILLSSELNNCSS